MEVWRRLKNILAKPKTPEQQAKEQIAAIEASIVAMSSAAQQSASEAVHLRSEAEEQRRRERTWEEDARDCIRRGDEAAARECLRRAESARLAAEHAEKLAQAAEKDANEKMQRTAQLRAELEALRAQANLLSSSGQFADAEATASRARAELSTPGIGSLDALRSDVESRQLEAEVQSQLANQTQSIETAKPDESSVERRFDALKAEVEGKHKNASSADTSERRLSEKDD
ncbi:MAG: hypothetical protein ACP5R4_06650 [Armatimonadota bacterium]